MSFVRNRELFREFIGADIFTCFPLFLSLLQRSHSPFQSALLPLLVSFCTVHDIFHGLNTNHVRVGILVTLVNVESSTSKNIAPFARRIATTPPTTTPSVHGYLLNNDLPLSLSPVFFSLILSLFCFLRVGFAQRNAHSPAFYHYRDRSPTQRLGKPGRFQNNTAICISRVYFYRSIRALHRFVATEAQKLRREREREN